MRDEIVTGAWQLVEWRTLNPESGEWRHPFGVDARGLLLYAPEGVMGVTMAPGDPASSAFVSYAGRWRLDAEDVVHDVQFAHHPSLVGTSQRRQATVRDGELLLRGIETGSEGRHREHHVRWRRISRSESDSKSGAP